ncbi:Tafazzin [Dimargaris cristalligena]|uniref:Tafazzin family protein n=1 Tax=Dimargaris cristalligena TaxID=215637 RepID=A0A4P9ZTW2_9FUNG|nr:Tafazzin [Dimargaris cristalligena]|eukprot:RKP36965.1 Tafazzin [Dimargaris cristalligena]
MNLFTTTEVVNAQCLIDILDERETTPRPLITVANHISALDDPLLWGFLPLRQLLNRNKVRWCLAAKELLFTNRLFITFFTLGQTMPLARGAGIFQPYLDNAIHRLNQNKWVHLFPEGKIDQTPAFSYFRWGVARLVMEADATPLVVPIWHTGMDKLFPTEPSRRPLVLGQRMKIVVGEPLDFAPLLQQSRLENWSPAVTRARITERVKEAIQLLEKKHRIPA